MIEPNELYHHGVKGMKWGVRKRQEPTSSIRRNYDSAKASYKSAKKAYSKAFNKADNRRIAAFSPSKKQRQRNTQRWEDVYDKAVAANEAQSKYKQAKKERKTAIKSAYKKLNKSASLGEKLMYSDGTRKKAAKYVVDNNMSVAEANKKAKGDALRNTGVMLAAYGAVTVASLYKMSR